MFPQAAYGQHIVQLAPGDSVLFATDGLHESSNSQGVEFFAEHIAESGSSAATNRRTNL